MYRNFLNLQGKDTVRNSVGKISLNYGRMRAWRIVEAEDSEGHVGPCILLPLEKNGLTWHERRWKGGVFYHIYQTFLIFPEHCCREGVPKNAQYAFAPYIGNDLYQSLVSKGFLDPRCKKRSQICGYIFPSDSYNNPQK